MRLLDNRKIGTKIVLALAMPVVGFVFYAGVVALDSYRQSADISALQRLSELAPVASNLVHELQKERGASAVFVSSKGESFRDGLSAQLPDTDKRRSLFEETLGSFAAEDYGEKLVAKLDAAEQAVGELDGIRKRIDNLKITPPESAKYFTSTIARLLAVIEEMSVISHNPEVTNKITAYTAFLQAKERAGQERATGAAGFGAQQFNAATFQRFVTVIAEQETFMRVFRNFSSPAEIAMLDEALADPISGEVARIRKIALESMETNDLGGVTGPVWFKAITAKINLLKGVEDGLTDALGSLTERVKGDAESSFAAIGIATLVMLLLTIASLPFFVGGITRPIRSTTNVMTKLAEGDLEVDIEGTERTDEIGAMARAVSIFKDNAVEAERLRGDREAQEQRAQQSQKAAMQKLADDFEATIMNVVEKVSGAAQQMQSSAKKMGESAVTASKEANVVASTSVQMSSNVQAVAASSEELTSAIHEIARQVAEASSVSAAAVEEGHRVSAQIASLSSASQKIGEVVGLITDIAGQTNLLALNATIEAARAGEAGKGFAVVASEVKNLANQTALATEETAGQITAIQDATNKAVQAIASISATIGRVSEISSAIAAAVEEQGAATQEISTNVQQAASGTDEVNQSIVQVSGLTSDTGKAAEEVMYAAENLSREGDELRSEVQRFLAHVRAA